jgi:hypothetical protein
MLDGRGVRERGLWGGGLLREEKEGSLKRGVNDCFKHILQYLLVRTLPTHTHLYPHCASLSFAILVLSQVRGEPHVIALNELACTFLVLTRSASSRATPQASSSSSSSWSGGASNQPDDDAAVRVSYSLE